MLFRSLHISPIVREFRGALDYHEGKQQLMLRIAGQTDAAPLAQIEKLLTRLAAVTSGV